MQRYFLVPLSATLAFLVLSMVAQRTEAQSGSRNSGGFGSFEANRVVNQATAGAFTVDQVIRQNLNRLRVRTNVSGVPSAGSTPLPPSSSTAPRAPSLGLNNRRPASRPFSNLNRRPTISPYLNLFRDEDGLGSDGTDLNYQTLVRPQLRQQEFNRQQSVQMQALNARLQNLAAQPAFSPTGSQSLAPTGSPSAFRYYSHFYPGQR